MLILILINVQYLQNVIFSFERGSSDQNHFFLDSHRPIENPPQANFPSLLPFHIIWKTLGKRPSFLKFVCLFQVKFNFFIDNIFFRVVSWHQKCIDL